MRSKGFELKVRRYRLEIMKKFFTQRVMKPWNRLYGEAVDAPSGSAQGQIGKGFEQPDLVRHIPDHCKGAGTGLSLRSFPLEIVL